MGLYFDLSETCCPKPRFDKPLWPVVLATDVQGGAHPARSLPTPTGAQPLWDARWLLTHSEGDRARDIVKKYDIRCVVLHKESPVTDWRAFAAREDLYHVAYENETEVIIAPR